MNILRDANIGKQEHAVDAETTPLRDSEHYQYDMNLRDIAEVWRRGSVIASWLLDLTATALLGDAELQQFSGRVSDSGEGGGTIKAAIDEAVPAPVLTTALYERFASRGEAGYADKLLSAMRFQFGGHVEKAAGEEFVLAGEPQKFSTTTHVQPVSASVHLLPIETRVPLKFGPEITTQVTCARVRLTVADGSGRTAEGWGETPLSVQWVWPSTLSYESRHEVLKRFCVDLVSAWSTFRASG